MQAVLTHNDTLTLCQTRLEMIESTGRLSQLFGLPRSTGQIYGLLYLAPTALSLDDIVELLKISKASASNGTRQLESWNLIRQVWIHGNRRDHYEIVADIPSLLGNLCSGFLKPRLRSSERRLTALRSTLDQDLAQGEITAVEHKLMVNRLKELITAQKKIEAWIPAVEA